MDVFTEEDDTNDTLTEHKHVSYDEKIIPVLEDIKRSPLQENDSVILITGRPGTGKSKLAQDLALYLDPKFTIDQIVFNHKDLIDMATTQLEPGRAIIFDEAAEATDSAQTLSQKNQRMGKFLATVRSRCLFIILIQPSFWNFQMSIATERSDILIHVYKVKNRDYDRNDGTSVPFERGFYNVFNYTQKKFAYIKGKKWHTYSKAVKPSITGARFGSRWVIDKAEYQRRKDLAVAEMNSEGEENELRRELGKDNNRVNQLRLRYLKSFKQNWPSMTLDTFAQLSGENKRALLLVMDHECRKLFDIAETKPKRAIPQSI